MASSDPETGLPNGTIEFEIRDAAGELVYRFGQVVEVVDGESAEAVLEPDWSLLPLGKYTVVGRFTPRTVGQLVPSNGKADLTVVQCASRTELALDPTSVRSGVR